MRFFRDSPGRAVPVAPSRTPRSGDGSSGRVGGLSLEREAQLGGDLGRALEGAELAAAWRSPTRGSAMSTSPSICAASRRASNRRPGSSSKGALVTRPASGRGQDRCFMIDARSLSASDGWRENATGEASGSSWRWDQCPINQGLSADRTGCRASCGAPGNPGQAAAWRRSPFPKLG